MTSQLPLFDDPALQQLQAENTWLRERLDHAKAIFRQQRADLAAAQQDAAHWYARCLTLQDELEGAGGAASDEHRALQAQMKAQARTIRSLESSLEAAESMVRLYKSIADAALQRCQSPPSGTREIFTKLLTLCHPDRWQNQPAETLAHEMAVVLNAVRQQERGRP